ncbi:DUF55-domain-containing protein [Coprinopsis marcescibilis]|uniref:DUF55-domain-containing protein n=1 Tax=Coprinopsis marcescibilis TaxID=230819 RepID=A0A5C3L8K2_COPMA|nr:DUF55-domain-containing protein [Coprinopsis marcescibilis]
MSDIPQETSGSSTQTQQQYYLLKAEPDSRVVKGKDVKFSVEDFESVKTSPWEGVRNFEARNIMKEMKVGDKALFYHSNCKSPGIAAFAEVSKEAYPDFTAWDTTHPYYDPKTDQNNPKWFMVDLTFVSQTKNFVPLSLLRYIASIRLSGSDDDSGIPSELSYLGRSGIEAIQGMDLVTRGRLSVQRVRQREWEAIQTLAEKGGWEELNLKKPAGAAATSAKSKRKRATGAADDGEDKPTPKRRNVRGKSAIKSTQRKKQPSEARSESPLTELEDEEENQKIQSEEPKPKTRKAAGKPKMVTEPPEGARRSKRNKVNN